MECIWCSSKPCRCIEFHLEELIFVLHRDFLYPFFTLTELKNRITVNEKVLLIDFTTKNKFKLKNYLKSHSLFIRKIEFYCLENKKCNIFDSLFEYVKIFLPGSKQEFTFWK